MTSAALTPIWEQRDSTRATSRAEQKPGLTAVAPTVTHGPRLATARTRRQR